MSRFWSAGVADLTPYVPGEQPQMQRLIKLNTNENPYGPSPRVLAAIREALGSDADALKLYPDPDARRFKETIAKRFGLEVANVHVGNGSDEVLANVFQGLLKHDKPILFPDITYSFYPVYCGLYGVTFENVPLTEAFEIRVDDYLKPNGGIIFPNPNAPTGRVLASGEIERLLAGNPDSVVVIDEAYIDFGGESAAGLIAKYPNLLVVQTLSKSRSLAGLRLGFAIGHPDLIEALERVKNSFNSYPLDRLAQAAGVAAIEDEAYFDLTRQAVIASREGLVARLQALGFDVLPSTANFVFARHASHDAAQLAAALRERSIIVRHFKHARVAQFLRITVGTEDECQTFTQALKEILAG
ncbi:histidinol-phosphate transaminase [Pandoraea fibrosis]|uniref:Histidinol-phosphate aminotransferase n=1 Tax=Pandoraea fibrosis TaxID=1891094 RepID=A0ABX6HUY8_9BURK|nr:histidinol-phosphate transaminase [Pandoraea fibrosis]QHE92086.1 histidinol-phosphate transaminase [Pandoraea fibrosis]QHF14357.1 histidinol-phosphate transaminase [Pandoraea fibrosis]